MPLPNRRTVRLPRFDYGAHGAYFITVCARDRAHVFGTVRGGRMCLNDLGALVWREWLRSAEIREEISAGAFIVMPNHWHGLVHFHRPPYAPYDPLRVEAFGKPTKGTLPGLMRGLKSAITSCATAELGWPGGPVCQSRHWEHVGRNADEYDRIEEYILCNPQRWEDDCFHAP